MPERRMPVFDFQRLAGRWLPRQRPITLESYITEDVYKCKVDYLFHLSE